MDGFAGSPDEQGPQQRGPQDGDGFAGDQQQQPQKVLIQNTTPAFLRDCFYFVIGVLETYGWFIVLSIIILVFLWYKFQPFWFRLLKKWEEQQEIAHFDPEKAAELQNKIDRSRLRWQEIQDAKGAKYAEERKKLEEEKRQELVEDWERHKQGKGYKSRKFKASDETSLAEKISKPKKKKPDGKNTLKPQDSSPLSGGSGGSCSWRPTRRGGGGGG